MDPTARRRMDELRALVGLPPAPIFDIDRIPAVRPGTTHVVNLAPHELTGVRYLYWHHLMFGCSGHGLN